MWKQNRRQFGFVAVLAMVLCLAPAGAATAAQSSSSHYSVNNVQIGGAGSGTGCSASFCAQQSAGDTVVGSGKSPNYSAQFGSNTTDQPLLEIGVESGNQNLGVLDPTITATTTAVIKVRSYLSDGYTLYIAGAAPSQGTHTLSPILTQSTSQPGAEQFGINLVGNDTPEVGADPKQVPSSTFSHGVVADSYAQKNLFMYHNGDAVASSADSTGETDYTLSMILNISNVTPGGKYTATFSAIVAPIF